MAAHAGDVRRWLAHLPRTLRRVASGAARRRGPLPDQHGDAARAPGQGRAWWRDRQPVDSVGRHQGRCRPRRLPSGVAARPGRDRRRDAGGGAPRQRAARARVPHGHAGARRTVAAEHVARRSPLLGRRAARRGGVSDPAGRRPVASRCARRLGGVADGAASGVVPGARRAGDAAGPLGRGCRLLAVHPRRVHRGSAGRGRPRRSRRRARRLGLPA